MWEPSAVLDRLRAAFPYVVAVVVPLAGILLAAARVVEGDRDDALRIGLATLLGVALYALLFA
jgi:hypothetical protein